MGTQYLALLLFAPSLIRMMVNFKLLGVAIFSAVRFSACVVFYNSSAELSFTNYDFIIAGGMYSSSESSFVLKRITRQVELLVSLSHVVSLKIPKSKFSSWKRVARAFPSALAYRECHKCTFLPNSHRGVLDLQIPFLAASRLLPQGSPFAWNTTSTAQSGLNGRSVYYSRGQVLGGSSSHSTRRIVSI